MSEEQDWCFFHGHEPVPQNAYRLCLECGHAYTWLDLWWRVVRLRFSLGMWPLVIRLRREFMCPLCGHDF